MNQQIVDSNRIKQNNQAIPKIRIYIVVMGYKTSGKTQLVESMICSKISPNSKEYKIIKYGPQQLEEYNKNVSYIQTPSLFHSNLGYLKGKVRIVDTPGIKNFEEVEAILNKVAKIVRDYPVVFIWVLDYSNMMNYKIKTGIISGLYGKLNKNYTYIEVINKIDLRNSQDQQLNQLCQEFSQSYLFLFSAKNFFQYQIMNYGREQEQLSFINEFFQQNGQFLQLDLVQFTKFCNSNIKNNKNLISTEYQFINFLQTNVHTLYNQNLIIKQNAENLFRIPSINIPQQIKQQLPLQLKLIQQEINKQTYPLVKQHIELNLLENLNKEAILNQFIQHNQDKLKLIDQIHNIYDEKQKIIFDSSRVYIDEQLNQEDEFEYIVPSDHHINQFNLWLNGYLEKKSQTILQFYNQFLNQQQEIILQFNQNLEKYVCKFGRLQSIFLSLQRVTYPLLFIELGSKLNMGTLIATLNQALKQQNNEIDRSLIDIIQKYEISSNQILQNFLDNIQKKFNQIIDQLIQMIHSNNEIHVNQESE